MVWEQILLLAVAWMAEGFNIYEKPVDTFDGDGNDFLFGQTVVQSKVGVLISSPNSKMLFRCALNAQRLAKCSNISDSTDVKGLKPIVSVANFITDESEKSMVCQQLREKQTMNEDFNGECTFLFGGNKVIRPATLVVDEKERNHNNNKNNNNNNNNDDDDEDEAGTEIGFVLDGSSSIEEEGFHDAIHFISKVMTIVWEKCFNCNFAVVQYGSKIRSELSLTESIKNGTRALEKVSNIQQIKEGTITASAIQYLLNHSFTPENGSNPDVKKIIIVLSDGAISNWDKINLPASLRMLEDRNVTRFAIGVGNIKTEKNAKKEMLQIAGDEQNFMYVDEYKALHGILDQLETSIFTGIEGLNQGDGFKFQLSEAGFSSHITHDEFLLFGAVGANDWNGGIIVIPPNQQNVTFMQESYVEEHPKHRFSYLGYSVLSVIGPSEVLYISGAPRYNLTGGVFVFKAASHEQHQLLQGEQFGSYFGSVLCAVDIDKNGVTDYLLIGAQSFYQSGEEGKVYIYKLEKGTFQKEDFEWQGLERYVFARFGSAIASIGDLDGNRYNDVVVGAPLEEDDQSGSSGSIYVFNGFQGRLQHSFSQRITPAALGMKLTHFGQSVSAFSNQMDKERLRYISVASKGNVTILETLPVIAFKPRVKLTPDSISLSMQMKQIISTVSLAICFNTIKGAITGSETLHVQYDIDLDIDQSNKRLTFDNKADQKGMLMLLPDVDCSSDIQLSFVGCEDCYSPIEVSINISLNNPANKKPLRILDNLTPNVVMEEFKFEHDCAIKDSCVENISLSDSKLNPDTVVIGSSKSIAISFNLTNNGDELFKTMLVLRVPNVLQYSHMIKQNSALEVVPFENQINESFSELQFRLLHPTFKRGAQANFSIHWQIVDKKAERHDAEIHAKLTCANRDIQVLDTKMYTFGMKNALKVQLSGSASPHLVKIIDSSEHQKDITFTFKFLGDNKYNATLKVTIVLTMPAHFTYMEVTKVEPQGRCEVPLNPVVPTQGGYTIKCTVSDLQDITVKAHTSISDVKGTSSNISASANVEFDKQFHLMSSKMPSTKVHVMILKQKVVQSKAAIIGGSIGGVVVLVVFIVILIKCGFFKRHDPPNQDHEQNY